MHSTEARQAFVANALREAARNGGATDTAVDGRAGRKKSAPDPSDRQAVAVLAAKQADQAERVAARGQRKAEQATYQAPSKSEASARTNGRTAKYISKAHVALILSP